MIIQKEVNGIIHSYSDNGVKIRQIETDTVYDIAYDISPCPFTYEETSIPQTTIGEDKI